LYKHNYFRSSNRKIKSSAQSRESAKYAKKSFFGEKLLLFLCGRSLRLGGFARCF